MPTSCVCAENESLNGEELVSDLEKKAQASANWAEFYFVWRDSEEILKNPKEGGETSDVCV